MEKEALGLSPANENVVLKRLSKGTNTPYEKKCTSLLAFRERGQTGGSSTALFDVCGA